MNHPPRRTVTDRIYVKVNAGFDSTGYMQPTSIIWSDGRIFPIEKIRDFRPASSIAAEKTSPFANSDCYTIVIQGHDRHLFFEHASPLFRSVVGRWYVISTLISSCPEHGPDQNHDADHDQQR